MTTPSGRAVTTRAGAAERSLHTSGTDRPSTTFDRVPADPGGAIVRGELGEGHTTSVEALGARTGASRSIVREAVRVLVALGLLSAGRRVGLRVLPRSGWDVIDPLVVGWRLGGPDRGAVLAELRSLRRVVEPAAASEAAVNVASGAAPAAGLEALLAAASRLTDAGGRAGATTFLQADRDLHRLVLELSGNAVFVRLHRVVARAIDERADITPRAHDVALHRTLAERIVAGDRDGAASAMQEIVDRT